MSLKNGDFTVWNDESIGTNQIKLYGSFFEEKGELHESSHTVKIKTKGNKRIYLNAIKGSKEEYKVNMHPDVMGRLKIKQFEKVKISRFGRIDKVIQILTACNLAVFSAIAAAFAIVLVILVVILPFLYIIWMIIVFFIIFIFLVILSYILRLFIIRSA